MALPSRLAPDCLQMPTTSTAAASKEVEQLRAENEALRLALARLQGVSPAEVGRPYTLYPAPAKPCHLLPSLVPSDVSLRGPWLLGPRRAELLVMYCRGRGALHSALNDSEL